MRDQTDLVRDAILRYVEAEEKRLGLSDEPLPNPLKAGGKIAAAVKSAPKRVR